MAVSDWARLAAIIYSFLSTYEINNVEPFGWLKVVLQRIQDNSIQKLDESDESKEKVQHEKEQIEEIISAIKESELYKSLDENNQNKIKH